MSENPDQTLVFDLGNGAKMELVMTDGQPQRADGRHCGSCSLCCRLLPVRTLRKGANTRCRLSRHREKGCCTVYDGPRMPPECQQWSCRWVVDPNLALGRPDRVHYVIDVLPDFAEAKDQASGETRQLPLVQIWLDPAYPDAHKDPKLRAWISANYAETGMYALIRTSDDSGFLLVSPNACQEREWLEVRGNFGQAVGLWNKGNPFPPQT